MTSIDLHRALVKAGVDDEAAKILARRATRPDFNLSVGILAAVTILGFTVLFTQVDRSRDDLTDLKVQTAEIKTEINVMKAEINVMKADISIMKADISVLKDQNARILSLLENRPAGR